jgi:CubicO group peptidase (beta-lactamase class C family)
MLFFAINEGRVAGVDQLVGPTGGWPLKQKDQAMTFRHLANMVSGYALPEEPGVAWAYNDYGIELYSKTVFDIVFDEGSADIAARHPERLGALEFEDGGILGPGRGGFALQTSLRDFARIGLFWLNRGNWNGTQILPEGYFDFFTPQVPADLPRTAAVKVNDYLGVGSSGGGANQTPLGPGIYGFNLWHNPDRTTWPNAPPDAYQANGHWNGEVLTVIPTLGIVAAWKGKRAEASSFTGAMDRLLKLLVEAAE